MNIYTKTKPSGYILRLLIIGFTVIMLGGCVTNTKRYHVPNYEYDYYPDVQVYFDIHRRTYIYYHVRHGWLTVSTLPSHIYVSGRKHHRLRFKHNRPWSVAHSHKRKHHQYHNNRSTHRQKEYSSGHDRQYRNKRQTQHKINVRTHIRDEEHGYGGARGREHYGKPLHNDGRKQRQQAINEHRKYNNRYIRHKYVAGKREYEKDTSQHKRSRHDYDRR